MKRKFLSLASLFVLGTVAGPRTVWAQDNPWTAIGREGGSVRLMAVDPHNSSTVYVGTAVGIFKSQDRAASWSNSGLIGYVVAILAIDQQDSNTLYAVTQGRTNLDTATMNVFRSTNGGTSWNEAERRPGGNLLWVCPGD